MIYDMNDTPILRFLRGDSRKRAAVRIGILKNLHSIRAIQRAQSGRDRRLYERIKIVDKLYRNFFKLGIPMVAVQLLMKKYFNVVL